EMLDNQPNEGSNHWLSPILLNSDTITPQIVIDKLNEANMESRPVWKPMHMQPIFKDCDFFGSNVSQVLFEKGICLPSDTKMSLEEQDKVIRIIKSISGK